MANDSIILLDKICSTCEKSLPNITNKNISFLRKVGYSGRSLTIHIPEDIAKHTNIEKGSNIKIIPVNKKSFLVEIVE